MRTASKSLEDEELQRIHLFMATSKWTPKDVLGVMERLSDRVYKALEYVVEGAVVIATCNRFEV